MLRFGRPGFTILGRPIPALHPGEWRSLHYTYNAAHLSGHFTARIEAVSPGRTRPVCNPANGRATFTAQ